MLPFYIPWKYRKEVFTWNGLMVDKFVLFHLKVSYSDQTDTALNGYPDIHYYRSVRKFYSTIQKKRILNFIDKYLLRYVFFLWSWYFSVIWEQSSVIIICRGGVMIFKNWICIPRQNSPPTFSLWFSIQVSKNILLWC